MKRFFLSLSLLLSVSLSFGQLSETDKLKSTLTFDNKDTVAWLHAGVAQIGLNQGFLHNWAAGGEIASLAIDGLFSGNLTRLYHKHLWSTSLDANYSLFYAYSNHFVPRKVDDRLDLTSRYGYRLDTSRGFYLSALLNFRTQFTYGYDYNNPEWERVPTSNFLAPGYLTLALGMEYRRGNALSLFYSPLALRFTFVDKIYTTRYLTGAFGVPYGETSRTELGSYFTGRYLHEFSKSVLFRTRLDLYMNYLAKDKTDTQGNVVSHDNPGNIDVFWDNLLSVKLSKFLTMTVAFTAIYDNDIPYQDKYLDPDTNQMIPKEEPAEGLGWWQVKEVVSFGFAYKF